MESMNLKLILLIILAVALALLIVLLFLQRQRRRKTHRSAYIDALYALIENRKEDALKLLTKAVKNGEGDADAYLQLGNLLREKNQPEKALQIHRSLTVRRDLSYEEEKAVQMALADDLADLGRLDRAIQTLESIYSRKKDGDILVKLHTLYHRSGDFDRAYSLLKDLSRIDPEITRSERAAYLATVAAVLHSEKRMEESQVYLERAIKEDKNAPSAVFLIGQNAMREGDLGKAAEMWTRLLKNNISCFCQVIPLLEKVLYESGRFQELETVLKKLLMQHDSQPDVLNALASFYEKKGETGVAVRILEDARDAIRSNPLASIRLASLYLQTDREEEARRILEELDLESRKAAAFVCGICGNHSDIPLAYCNQCNHFNSFKNDYEKNPH